MAKYAELLFLGLYTNTGITGGATLQNPPALRHPWDLSQGTASTTFLAVNVMKLGEGS